MNRYDMSNVFVCRNCHLADQHSRFQEYHFKIQALTRRLNHATHPTTLFQVEDTQTLESHKLNQLAWATLTRVGYTISTCPP